ncbi:MAG: hypothetical protein ACLGHX_05665 [Acidimicrobiia bacterium]
MTAETTQNRERFGRGFEALDAADAAVRELHEGCCQPLRSPRMERLAATIADVRTRLTELGDDPADARAVVEVLSDAGGQLGTLQVECCAPGRMPLYTSTLTELFKVQRLVTGTFDLEH